MAVLAVAVTTGLNYSGNYSDKSGSSSDSIISEDVDGSELAHLTDECVSSAEGCRVPLPNAEPGTALAANIDRWYQAAPLHSLALQCEAGDVTGERCTQLTLTSGTVSAMLFEILHKMDSIYNTSEARTRAFYACKYNQWAVGSLDALPEENKPATMVRFQQCQLQMTAHRVQELHRTELGGEPAPPQQRVEVPRRNELSYKDFYNDFALKSIPVVATGTAMTGPTPWDIETLIERCGTAPVRLRERAGGDKYGKSWAGLVHLEQEITLGEFLREFQQGKAGGKYLFDWSIPTNCPDLLEKTVNFTLPSYIAGDLFQVLPGASYAADSWPSLLVGEKGSGSGLHIDSHATHFWMYLVQGRKQWKIFSRDDVSLLEPNFFWSGGATFDRDSGHQNGTKAYVVDLLPGEFLIIPYGFPHQVLNLEDSIAIAGNFVDPVNLRAMVSEIQAMGASGIVQGEVDFAAALEAADLTSLSKVDLGQQALSWREFKARRAAAAA